VGAKLSAEVRIEVEVFVAHGSLFTGIAFSNPAGHHTGSPRSGKREKQW
jgi:hypothetical protein